MKVFGRRCALPAVKSNAADSPIILPIARITPVTIPGIADGRRIVLIVYHLPAPKPTAPVLKLSGTVFNASCVFLVTSGSTINVSVREPVRSEYPM